MAAVLLGLAASTSSALAQCAMCRAALGNSTEAAKASSSMNLAVLVLLVPPVALFCAFFIVAYRLRKAPGEVVATKSLDEQSIQGRARARASRYRERHSQTGWHKVLRSS